MLRPRAKGSYLLVVSLRAAATLEVGGLGRRVFPPGYYVYAGSALGGIRGRLRRHASDKKTPRWPIHYLTGSGVVTRAVIFESGERLECHLADILKRQLASVPDFGCSDCRCAAHLFFAAHEAELKAGLEGTLELTPARPAVLSRNDLRRYLGLVRR